MRENPLASDLDHVLDHTRGLWEDLRGERVFITGGTGFFGCWLLESLLWAQDRLGLGVEAVVLTRNPDAFRIKAPHLAGHPAIVVHLGDVRSFQFPTGAFSHVIHTASESSRNLDDKRRLEMLDTIVQGTRHTLEFAEAARTRKFLFTSSGAVYGTQPGGNHHIDEDDFVMWPPLQEPDFHTIYRQGKLISELVCRTFQELVGVGTRIARCFAFVGPYLPLAGHFAAGDFIRDAVNGGPVRVHGDGTAYRSYLYAADLAIWLWTILVRGAAGRTYNVGAEAEVTIAELAGKVATLVHPELEVVFALPPDSAQHADWYVPSTRRARSELGLDEWIGVDLALKKTFGWFSAGRNQ